MAVKRTVRKKPRRVAKIGAKSGVKKRPKGAIKISARRPKKKRIVIPPYGRAVRKILRTKQHELKTMIKKGWGDEETTLARAVVLTALYDNAVFFTSPEDFRKALLPFSRTSRKIRTRYDRTKAAHSDKPRKKLERVEALRDVGVRTALSVVYARDLFAEINTALFPSLAPDDAAPSTPHTTAAPRALAR